MSVARKIVRGACPHDCPDQCGWDVVVANDRVVDVVGDKTHPFTEGVLCTKLKRFPERVYHPERILYPLRRKGAKGEANFERVSWDEALSDIANRMRQVIDEQGPQAILPYHFAGTIGILQRNAGVALFRHLGATGLQADWCGSVAYAGVAQTNGSADGVLPEDIAYSRLIVLWGTNTAVTNLHLWSGPIRRARREGARVVVIDPVKTQTAEHADTFLQIRPGTDAALALGLMHVIIRDGLVDDDYVEHYTVGFEQLAERVNAFDPERVAGITGIAREAIEALARALGTTRPAVIRVLVGMERRTQGASPFRAIACLPALTGAWRERGGGLAHFTADLFRSSLNYEAVLHEAQTPEPARWSPIAQLGRALTELSDPAIGCLFVYNANPMVAAPNQNLVRRGLQREDLFTVVAEQFMTDTARYADYVLPATTQVEHWDLMPSWGQPYLVLNKPAIDPVGEAKSNTALFRELAERLGCAESFLMHDDVSMIRGLLDSEHPYLEGIDFDQLERDGWVRLNLESDRRRFANGEFDTASGKCEFYSEALAEAGHDPLPFYAPSIPRGEDRDQYPLMLIAAKSAHHALNSQYDNLQRENAKRSPKLLMNPVDAGNRNIKDGEQVRVFNHRGEVVVNVAVGEATAAGTMSLPFNCWPRSLHNDASANALTRDGLNVDGMGSDAFDTYVDVEPVT